MGKEACKNVNKALLDSDKRYKENKITNEGILVGKGLL